MATKTQEPPPATQPRLLEEKKHWTDRFFHSGFFLAALLFHLIIFLMVATWIIFPAYKAPVDEFTQTYLPPASPPPPPPPTQAVVVPTHTVAPPTPTITTSSATPTFSIPLPDFTHTSTPDNVAQKMTAPVVSTPNNLQMRLASINKTVQGWGRDAANIRDSNSDPRNITAKFPVYLASYADGDWGCNVVMEGSPPVVSRGSLPNLVKKINEWSHGKITGTVVPQPLSIGGPDLLDKKPPFVFFTGHKDFKLTDTEIQNLRDYLQVGGAIWGDNSLAGRGSRFDVAFRREMKRVVPDPDKNFVPYAMTDDVFTKSWYPITVLPTGMNYYSEPIEHLDIDGKLAILYTPNDYGDMMCMRINQGDQDFFISWRPTPPGTLITNLEFFTKSSVFYRNFELKSCLAAQQLGMNIIGYLLVRFDKDLLLPP